MKNILKISLFVMFVSLVTSCQKDYIIGGEPNRTNVKNLSTFDLLAIMDETKNTSILFERGGYKEIVNGDVTVIAPPVWSINRYLNRKWIKALALNPEAEPFTLDDIDAVESQKMGMYIFPGTWWRNTIPADGVELTSVDGKQEARILMKQTNSDAGAAYDGGGTPGYGYQYTNFMETVPYLIYIHFKRGDRWETYEEREAFKNNNQKYMDNPECDHVYRMYVSDIITTTGVAHVLYRSDEGWDSHNYAHVLFFFGTKDDDSNV